MLNRKWEVNLNSKPNINKKRKEFLTGKDFTTSIVSNLLELNGQLTFDELKIIDKIRKLRNEIAHKSTGVSIDSDLIRYGYTLLAKLLHQEFQVRININLRAFSKNL
ncbi:hypothetical protein LPTSP2_37560 [Leptospira ellinghausenii]|uniref:Uncharacterized protein n=1 Tax=Leptospira ellinghausenii TaxID=1917822 RepID=A0A2P2DIG5_9LEPT|nr:hypothetical protein [Leptospira ellinghausenii]GBF44453.1 hypothetical protein LPTSP2_37560 [Leptospira ellinghausenii]